VRQQPILNAPPVVLGVLVLLAVVHLARSLLGEAQDEDVIWALAFVPARYAYGGSDLIGGELARFTSPVTYMLLHGDWSHLLINGVWLLVFGTPIARRLGPVRFLLFTVFCGLSGALAFWIFNADLAAPMIGASGAISGLLGGLLRFLFNALDQRRRGSMGPGAHDAPSMTFRELLADRRALGTIVIWLALNLGLATGLGTEGGPETVAWEAHLGGFIGGLCAFGLFDAAPRPTADATD